MGSTLNGLPTSLQGQSGLDWFFGTAPPDVVTTRESGSVTFDTGDQLPSLSGPPDTPLPPSFQVGKPQSGVWVPLADQDLATVGDNLRFTFRLKLPFLEDWQTGALASRLSKDDRFELHFLGVNEEQGKVRMEATVQKPMTPAILIAAAIVAVAVGIGVWIASESVEKLTTVQNPFSSDPTSKINLFPVLALGALALGALIYLPRLLRGRAPG